MLPIQHLLLIVRMAFFRGCRQGAHRANSQIRCVLLHCRCNNDEWVEIFHDPVDFLAPFYCLCDRGRIDLSSCQLDVLISRNGFKRVLPYVGFLVLSLWFLLLGLFVQVLQLTLPYSLLVW